MRSHCPTCSNSSPRTECSGKRSAMSARNSRSMATSMLVTRSIVPFFSTWRSGAPKCSSCTRPACIATSIAVARNTGGIDSGTGGGQLLDHPDFHSAVRRLPERHVIHEAAHEEDAATARLEEVLGGQGVGDFLGLEAFALVHDSDDQLARI